MNVLEIRITPDLYIRWPNGGGFQQVEMLINGVPLIDYLVRSGRKRYSQLFLTR